ncbi:triose-phosphate transporter [Colletotrichum higginsianum IMI 349063]|uniref:Triose-phosphate transporter n=2 Tax=Colletotrichum higginsianum (strain IMI 349063) TaxID=759273 RepID=A0A1B7YI83_COLHI|nr:triose-phosphate transporter [Colletotrichum higginsianum IMI 349063]OBR11783.1 triose-phosphate transporter [Colletotrichum higginsianum IMI 349063]
MSTLPTTEKPAGSRALHPALFIASWIFFSNLTILFNKWLLDTAGFITPRLLLTSSLAVILTCWHLVFSTFATQLLARCTSLLDGRHKVKMTGRVYLRAVVPIGLLYSGSLVCSNLVYLYLSVSFIQMLKAGAPVAVLFASWIWGVAEPSMATFYNILLIVAGVGLASFGEIEFSWIGFIFQMGGIIFEAIRLVMIQVLLKGDENAQRMDPLVSLYYYAPVCAVMNIFVAWASEFSSFKLEDFQKTGVTMLLLNAGVAFMLNVSSVFLIGKTSGLVMTLTGILKNILLIGASVIIWNTNISFIQFIGYGIALFGLVVYSTGWEQLKGSAAGAVVWARTAWNSHSFDEGRLSPLVRRAIFFGLLTLITVMLVLGFAYKGSSAPADWLAKVGTTST